MRNIWIGSLLVVCVLGTPVEFRAAEKPEVQSIQPLSSEAIYIGPMMDDREFEQRALTRRARQAGAIDIYNIWTSESRIRMNNNLEVRGHNYAICVSNGSIHFGQVVYAFANSVDVRVVSNVSKAARLTATDNFTLNGTGYWLLLSEYSLGNFPIGYYKVQAKNTVTRGGSGGGSVNAFFDVLGC